MPAIGTVKGQPFCLNHSLPEGSDQMSEFDKYSLDDRVPDGSPNAACAITVERDAHGLRIRIVGDLDLAAAPELERVLERASGDGYGRLLIDLHAVEFMDSTGLQALMRAREAADRSGHRLTLSYDSPQIHRLLEITAMLDLFSVE
jgi:anti-anti-sigma factor